MERPSSYEDGEKRGRHDLTKALLSQTRDSRETNWHNVNRVNPEGEEKRKELIQGLEEFQKATGIDEKKYIEELRSCKSNGEIFALEKKFKKAGVKWYEMQMQKSGVFEPLDDREESLIKEEIEGLIKWFSGLSLTGELSMISTLSRLDKDLETKRAFRNKLKKQSKFVKNEYFRRLGSLPLVGSKDQLLQNVLNELKGVEDAPSAVQHEFKKNQKESRGCKDTATIKKEVLDAYNKRFTVYKKGILDNMDYFGGEKVDSPWGKIPEAAKEFLDWFEDRESFAAMDEAIKKLPSLVAKRKKLVEKRDNILKNALPKDRERLTAQTNRMRRHELEAFLPELQEYVQKNSVHMAEYMSTILSARALNVDLYPPFERTLNIQKFKLCDFESQKARLIVLREEIEERAQVVREYFALPSFLRDDNRFIGSHSIDRAKLLLDAKEKRNKEQKSPFEVNAEDDFDQEDLTEIADTLHGHDGEEVVEGLLEKMGQEGLLKAAQVQEATHNKIFGSAQRAKRLNITQEESYLDDLKYWVRLDRGIKKESDVRNERERAKHRYIEAADEAYDLGYVVTSGGHVSELQEVNLENLEQGNGEIEQKLHRARYGEHVRINKKDGSDARNPLELIEELSERELSRLVLIALQKLAGKVLSVSGSNLALIRNSSNIQREMSERIIAEEFKHLKKAA